MIAAARTERRSRTSLSALLLGPQAAYLLARLPHLAVGDFLEFLLQLRPVIGPAIRFERPPRFFARFDRVIKRLKHGLRRVAELLEPIERPALGGRRAVRIHPIHPLLGDQWV